MGGSAICPAVESAPERLVVETAASAPLSLTCIVRPLRIAQHVLRHAPVQCRDLLAATIDASCSNTP